MYDTLICKRIYIKSIIKSYSLDFNNSSSKQLCIRLSVHFQILKHASIHEKLLLLFHLFFNTYFLSHVSFSFDLFLSFSLFAFLLDYFNRKYFKMKKVIYDLF